MDPTTAWDTELAWQLLTVLIRLGHPAAASELAAVAAEAGVAVSPQLVERLCSIHGSPLRFCDGAVTASETAVVAFLRFAGWNVSAPPMVSLRCSDERRRCDEVPIRYGRKRKASDARGFFVKRHLLMEADADLVKSKQPLIAKSYLSVPIADVRLEVMQDTRSTCHVGPSKSPNGVTLVPSIANISTSCLQPKLGQFLGGNTSNELTNIRSALVPMELSIPCVDIPLFCSEKSENIHAKADNDISRIEPGVALTLYNCREEDSDDKKESILPTSVEAVLILDTKVGIEGDLNLICKEPSSPFLCCNTKAAANTVKTGGIFDQAGAVWYDSPDVGYCEETPSCAQNDDACAEVRNNNTIQVPFQSSTRSKEENIDFLCQPSKGRKVGHAVLPVEGTSNDCIGNRNLNIITENKETTHIIHRKQTLNEVGTNSYKEKNKKTLKQKEKGKKNATLPKEGNIQLVAKAQKSHEEPKPLPSFKDFIVEEEEGSGGYGIVYRARRKSDGSVFAIKCPHEKAHSHHIDNERKMLERFGGRNFVIKYEHSLKSGELDCFVLEHIEHDKPENLKKEINLFELQWYGYCLFKALSSLHKQRIVHRDVKPGNFLFSRRQMKGYLIDFNLANDLHQKFLRNSKSETITCEKGAPSQPALKSALVLHAKEATPDSKHSLGSKRKRPNKSPVESDPKIDNKSRHSNQHADVSGVTSAKDPTSTKTSLDRLKQPLYKGRKELMNFLHETMHSPSKNTLPAPASQRKRVAAPVDSVDRKLFVLTPMPLRSGGTAVAGSGMFNSKGHGKQRREGPCVGTKGFRAPEVLLRSFHQGCKIDVWSAGVTLLYLIIGKTPFGGDPEQNIKEIAKIRGSEELWEVAKLHNCESSYPSDLFDVKSLNAVDLREWCAANARRPDFLNLIPDSLFDLVDVCLAVNPRSRITSDEALMHEFFAPCRESLRKQKMLRIRRSSLSAAAASNQPSSPHGAMMVVKANKS